MALPALAASLPRTLPLRLLNSLASCLQLAVIVANATCIPYYANGLKACARSMPTSMAMDLVAKKLNIPYFEVGSLPHRPWPRGVP